ncbi:MAG: hypothetical protein KDC02_25665, partial [Flavobacteriales bacterium]|nr:hypothetical protein [Flavobacteriales bacterium]
MKSFFLRNKVVFALMLIGGVLLTSAFQAIELPNVSQAVPVHDFVNFESAHIHPLDMTPDGSQVLAV